MLNKCDGVARLKRFEQRLDRRCSIFGMQIGWDAIIGLVPVVGDLVASAFGLYLILEARRLGARRWTMTRMIVNWGVDLVVGALPIVGDLFDVAYRSNSKNVKLLIADLERRAGELREVHRESQLRVA